MFGLRGSLPILSAREGVARDVIVSPESQNRTITELPEASREKVLQRFYLPRISLEEGVHLT